MARIAIIGAGEFGKALGFLLKKSGQTLSYWDVDSHKTGHDASMNDILLEADVVFFCVPSWSLRDALQAALLGCKPGAVFVSVAKGLEKDTNATTEDIFREEIGTQFPVVFLSGPMLAEEIVEHKPTGAILAGTDASALQTIARLFQGTGLRTSVSADVRGVVLCGVLKNVYTIAVGMSSALELGDNARGYFIAQALGEMAQMLSALGAQENTIYGPAGIGDFIATSAGRYSKNFSYGYTFVKNPERRTQSEGAASYRQLEELLHPTRGQYPLFDGIIEVLEGREEPGAFFKNYFNAEHLWH